MSIPYENSTLPGYLFLVDDSGVPRPTIIYTRGYDSTCQERYFVLAEFPFVVNPLARLVITSLEDGKTGAFTLANYVAAYGRARYLAALWNTLGLGVAVSGLCVLFAVPDGLGSLAH